MRSLFFPAALALASVLLLTEPAEAQLFSPEPTAVQAGLGAVPGAGIQVGYVQPRTSFTLEATLYADVQSLSDADDQRFQAAAAVGGALRLWRLVRIVTNGAGASELDVGLRAGPGLGFKADETRADKNRRFRLLLDPFIRYVQSTSNLTLFGEVGLARPHLRAGLWFSL